VQTETLTCKNLKVKVIKINGVAIQQATQTPPKDLIVGAAIFRLANIPVAIL